MAFLRVQELVPTNLNAPLREVELLEKLKVEREAYEPWPYDSLNRRK
jgi:hypothetical protein